MLNLLFVVKISELFHSIALLVWQAYSDKAESSLYKEILLFGAPLNAYQTDCEHVYTGQIKRQFGTLLKEHQKAIFLVKDETHIRRNMPAKPTMQLDGIIPKSSTSPLFGSLARKLRPRSFEL